MIENLYKVPKFIGNLDACYQQGQAACEQMFFRSDNPYDKNTKERESWDYGWRNVNNEYFGHQ